MRRREFIMLLGGAAATWPMAARGQQDGRMRRIGVLMRLAADDAQGQARIAAFVQTLQQLGWTEGRNVRIDYRWSAGDDDNERKFGAELIALAPDVILAWGSLIPRVNRTVPIVFAQAIDPVGSGWVESLARPGGNATGFTQFEFSLSVKWPELLKEIAPRVTRAAVLRDISGTGGIAQFAVIQGGASSLGMEVRPLNVRDAPEFERAIADFARTPNDGLIVTMNAFAQNQRELIVTLAAHHKLPTVFFERAFVTAGGLISYGPDLVDQYRRAAGYVDRVLRGAKPADLPVQMPTRYELVINRKTATALGLDVPAQLLVRADEVIE
jgi:putative ABC transport system substrate-binding protein